MTTARRPFATIRFWTILSVCVIVVLFAYYVASDRVTPMTNDAYVQAAVIPVAPLVSGEVIEVFVANSSEVKKGDPLFRIDPSSFQHEIDRLAAQAEQLRKEQTAGGGTPDSVNAELRAVQAALEEAKLGLKRSTILAPSDGIIDNMQLFPGVYAEVGGAVMTLVTADAWWIVANYEENALSVIREGQAVEFSLYIYPGRVFAGRVESIGWGVEKGEETASGSLPEIDNPERWVSLSQRFQVRVTPSGPISEQPQRVGATARVVVYTSGTGAMDVIARNLMRFSALTDYIY